MSVAFLESSMSSTARREERKRVGGEERGREKGGGRWKESVKESFRDVRRARGPPPPPVH